MMNNYRGHYNYLLICIVFIAEDLPNFPVDRQYLQAVGRRVELAVKLDKLEHRQRVEHSKLDWFQKTAQEMDIDIDEDLYPYNNLKLCSG